MIQANISKEANQGVIRAEGNVPELLNDMAILINGIYGQLRAAGGPVAQAFQYGLMGMVNDREGPVWNNMGNQQGIAIRKG